MCSSRIGLFLLASFAFVCSVAPARTILVVPSEEHPTIASAVKAADDGALVLVGPGIYRENIKVHKKSLELRSTHGPYETVINGMGTAPAMSYLGDKGTLFTLEGFSLVNGKGSPMVFGDERAGGLNLAKGRIFVQGNVVFGCTGFKSAGIYCTSDGTIRDNVIAFNSARSSYGGAFLSNAEIEFKNNHLIGNYCGAEAGGVYILSPKKPIRVIDNVFVENWSFRGAAMQVNAGKPLIEGNLFYHNRGCRGGGVLCFSKAAKPLIKGNFFDGNWACFGGAILSLYGGDPVIDGNFIAGNTTINVYCIAAPNPDFRLDRPDNSSIPPFSGAGICCWQGSTATIVNNVIVDNTARHRGGGVAVLASEAVLSNNTIYDNRSKWDAGGLYCDEKSKAEACNTIVRGNTPEQVSPRVEALHCNIEGGFEGEGNCDHDPHWIDAEHHNLRLAAGSPDIDAGTCDCAHCPGHDMDGDHRPRGAEADIGADEFVFEQAASQDRYEHFFHDMRFEINGDRKVALNKGLAFLQPWQSRSLQRKELAEKIAEKVRLMGGLASRWYDTDVRNPREPLPMDKALEMLIPAGDSEAGFFPLPVQTVEHPFDPLEPAAVCWSHDAAMNCPADPSLLGLSVIWIPLGVTPQGATHTGTPLDLSFH